MQANPAKQLSIIQWMLGGFTLVTALAVWWLYRQPLEATVDIYTIFPLLGLVAFGLMWTHFVGGALARYRQIELGKTAYLRVTMYIVLACIVAHPVLLWFALARDGFGLPPISQYTVYGTGPFATAALFVGMIALSVFLLYELGRWLRDKSWWKYIEWLQLTAMLLIFYHALTLGGELTIVWYQIIWWLYGGTLVLSTLYVYYENHKNGGKYDSGK